MNWKRTAFFYHHNFFCLTQFSLLCWLFPIEICSPNVKKTQLFKDFWHKSCYKTSFDRCCCCFKACCCHVFWGGERDDPTSRMPGHTFCIGRVCRPCASGCASLTRPTGRTSSRSLSTSRCTASPRCGFAGEPSGGSTSCSSSRSPRARTCGSAASGGQGRVWWPRLTDCFHYKERAVLIVL